MTAAAPPFELKPDFDAVVRRMDAWWNASVADRPLVHMAFPRPAAEQVPWPVSTHATLRDRWLDAPWQADTALACARNTEWFADALPVAMPNIGPDAFAAFYGVDLEFGDITSWSHPSLPDLTDETLAALKFDPDGFWFRKVVEITDAYLDRAAGKFLVGYTDFHPGGDALSAFRGPETLCMDVVECPEQVVKFVDRVTDDFLAAYDFFHGKLNAAGMPSTSWMPLTCGGGGRFHIPSNDFSCMISEEMFRELFLPGLVRECAHMDRNCYHLDGPGALRHLDALLEVPTIHAIQWVYGAGGGRWHDWIPVYQKIQDRGRAMILYANADDLDGVFDVLRPEGVFLSVGGVANRAEAEAILAKITRWKA